MTDFAPTPPSADRPPIAVPALPPPPLPLSPLTNLSDLPLPPIPPPGYIVPSPRPLRVWPVFVAFAALFCGTLGVSMVAFIIWIAVHGVFTSGNGSPAAINGSVQAAIASRRFNVIVMLGTIGMGAGAALIGASLSPVPMVRRLKLSRSRAGLFASLLLVVGALAVSRSLSSGLSLLNMRETGTLKMLSNLFAGLRGWNLVAMLAVVGVGAGVAEELFFRGYVQTRLAQRLGPFRAIAVTSLLFAFIHFDLAHSPFALGLGLYLGWVAWAFGSIRPAIVCHVINNCIAVLGAAFADRSASTTGLNAGLIRIAISIGVLIICAAGALWLRRSDPIVATDRE